ncbi:LAMI_0G13080g1_1 [Lachancea mirantina]|uniref:LAMI_0G13080g1_1 n=1 Tax=Lachancea mirantina TaxID=1230905 RepID=A0A1G4KBV2_9SACH|nr:LAMI_0G13080g1_1 [Lachancea mirantina]
MSKTSKIQKLSSPPESVKVAGKPASGKSAGAKEQQTSVDSAAKQSPVTENIDANDTYLRGSVISSGGVETLSRKEKRKLKKLHKKQELQQSEENKLEEEASESERKDGKLRLEKLGESDSEAESDEEEDEENQKEEEEEEEEDVPLSDVEFDSDADVVPHQKVTINNSRALKHSLERIRLPWKKHSFHEHQSITSSANTDEGIKDIYDDTERELAFYKQSLEAVHEAKEHLKRLKVPFKRPLDYFAEMVKSDEHMDKLKSKLVAEASDKKAREEARKQRQLKKFGKQVQVATLQKRQKEKRETLEKIKSLKSKRKHNEIGDSEFDVGVEDAASEKRPRPNKKRQAKDAKYGRGGMKRFKNKNDSKSSADVTDFSHRRMKGKAARPGKSRRSNRR